MAEESEQKSYGKRPMWQWIALYLVIGVIIYGVFYYFVLAKKGGYNSSNPTPTSAQTNTPSQTAAAKNEVTISNFSFSPTSLTVKVGDSVTWTNNDSAPHSATADDGSFDTGTFAQGESKTVTFSKAGSYTYHCSVHPNMKATIIVQ